MCHSAHLGKPSARLDQHGSHETAEVVAPSSMKLLLYPGVPDLPHLNPDHDAPPRDPAVESLRASIRSADAVLFSTPEYAGGLPGSFKNVLDWMVGDDQVGQRIRSRWHGSTVLDGGQRILMLPFARCSGISERGSLRMHVSTFPSERMRSVTTV